MPGLFNLSPINGCRNILRYEDNLVWYITTMCMEGHDMNWITPIRQPLARVALAVLNTGHPGPSPGANQI